jgi:hypothetical protein
MICLQDVPTLRLDGNEYAELGCELNQEAASHKARLSIARSAVLAPSGPLEEK